VIAALVVLAGCGNATEQTHSAGGTAVSEASGVVVNQDCRTSPLGDLLSRMKAAAYVIALVDVKSVGSADAAIVHDGIVFTPVSVGFSAVYAGQPGSSVVYVTGGEHGGQTTNAVGPEGLVPGGQAIVMMPPEKLRDGQPDGWVETALPVNGDTVFASDMCWKSDLPDTASSTTSVSKLVDAGASDPESETGFDVPIGDITNLLKSSG
jgi:hypothetical protein